MKYGTLSADLELEEGLLEVSPAFSKLNRWVKFHILGDWQGQIRRLFNEAEEACYPGKNARNQRFANWERREKCESLAGQTILTAKPLRNGNVELGLSDGRTLILRSGRGLGSEGIQISAMSAERDIKWTEDVCEERPVGHFTQEPSAQEFADLEASRAALKASIAGTTTT